MPSTLRRRRNGTPEIRLSLRAAWCLSVPLLVGLAVGERLYTVLFAIGALWAITQDGLDEWSIRGPRLASEAVAATVGIALGGAVITAHDTPTTFVLLLTLSALVAGVLEASQHPTPGTYLIVGVTLGAGLDPAGHVLATALAVGAGSLWVLLVAMAMDRRRRLANQRVFLSQAFKASADCLAALNTPDFHASRARAVAALDAAQDVIGSGPMRRGGAEGEALRQCLVVALRVGEITSYFSGKGLSPDPALVSGLRAVGGTLREGTGLDALELLSTLPARLSGIERVNPSILRALAIPDPARLGSVTRRLGSRAATRARLPWGERLRFGLTLALAVGVAAWMSSVLHGSHAFWLPMSVAFILRPDLGPVITRALARTAGTAIGVGIAALVSLGGNSFVSLIFWSCLMAAITPWAQRRSHVYAVMTITPIVFLFLGIVESDQPLFAPRILDTALAAVIVLVVDLLLWSTAPTLRPTRQLAAAREASERYQREATLDDPLARNLLRRRALRAVADARAALARATKEPIAHRRLSPFARRDLDDIESAIDAHTVELLDRD